jgi:uncharacterized protein DUF5819
MTTTPHRTRALGQTKRRSLVVRLVALASVMLALGHIFASFLWISPPSQLRNLIPGNALTSYMIPFFGQSWSVFAPAPINGDLILKIRAVVEKDGKVTTTKWIDATEAELSMSHHNLFPPRAANLAAQQAMEYKNAYAALTPSQKKVVGYGYYKGEDWLKRFEASITGIANSPQAKTFIQKERHTVAYSTQAARAIWGDGVKHVQFQVSRQNVVPFAERNNPDAKMPEAQVVNSGWRGTHVFAEQNQREFADIFKNLAKDQVTK